MTPADRAISGVNMTESRVPATADAATVHPRLAWYFEHPGSWPRVKQQIIEHDQSCISLVEVWTPRRGGVSCSSDLGVCDDCSVTFYNEGLMGQYPPDWHFGDQVLQTQDDEGDDAEARLCECCGRKRLADKAPPAEVNDV
jgi:hypothetical protein